MFRSITSSAKSLITPTSAYQSAYYTTRSRPGSVYSLASTSASTLDDPLPKPRSHFEQLLPDGTTLPISKRNHRKPSNRRNKRSASANMLPKLTAKAEERRRLGDLPSSEPTKFDRSQLSPHLPLVTRERNFIISNLKQALHAKEPSPDATWKALVPALQYPNDLPQLPLAFHPQSTRSTTDDGNTDHEPRSPINLTIAELRRAFTILASARPRSREGLARLLVVVELIAQHAATTPLPPAPQPTGTGRSQAVGQLRGDGVGLREQDWSALMLFAATSFRSPRATPEVEDAFGLFAQWERKQAGRVKGGQLETSRSKKVITAIYNALLLASAKARSWALFELTEKRMAEAKVSTDAYTYGIKLEKQARRGAHIDAVWGAFEAGLVRVARSEGQEGDDVAALWNMMLWALVKRGMLDEGMRLYQFLQKAEPVGLNTVVPYHDSATRPNPYADSLSPILSLLSDPAPAEPHADVVVTPPRPNIATYSMLIQAFAHNGDLRACLLLMRDLVTTPTSPSDAQPAGRTATPTRSAALQPTTHIFACLFRGFAIYGQPPIGHASWAADPHLLAGKRQRTNALSQAESSKPLDALAKLGATAPSRSASAGSAAAETGNAWTLPALKALLKSFLALEPPRADASELPHEGMRTAPSTKELWWLLLAVERLTGGDSRMVVETWGRVEAVFGQGMRHGDGKEVWTGWRVDNRLARKVEGLRQNIKEEEEREGHSPEAQV